MVHPGISFIGIDANNCFDISLDTLDGNEMIVEAKIDGEYSEDLLVKIRQEGSAILVGAGFHPNFTDPNDKLSAHKVVSIALRVQLPRFKKVELQGTGCNVAVSGNYESLKVDLGDGRCYLKNVSETVEVHTQSGDITVLGSNAQIMASSKFGKVQKNNIPPGNNKYTLSTVTGNIHLSKTE